MDGESHVSGARTPDRRGRGRQTATSDRAPRSRSTRDGSEGRGLAGSVITKGLRGEVVEAAVLIIALNLAIPGRPVVLQKPGAKLSQLLRGERLDILLDLLDFAHRFCQH